MQMSRARAVENRTAASEVRLEVGRFHDHHAVELQAAGEEGARVE